jgi:hypothetical protein
LTLTQGEIEEMAQILDDILGSLIGS